MEVLLYNERHNSYSRKTVIQFKTYMIIWGVNQHKIISEKAPSCGHGLLSHAAVQTLTALPGMDVWIIFIADVTGRVLDVAFAVIYPMIKPTPGTDCLMRAFRGLHFPGKV